MLPVTAQRHKSSCQVVTSGMMMNGRKGQLKLLGEELKGIIIHTT